MVCHPQIGVVRGRPQLNGAVGDGDMRVAVGARAPAVEQPDLQVLLDRQATPPRSSVCIASSELFV